MIFTLIEYEVSGEEYQDLLDEKRKHGDIANDLNRNVNDMLSNNPAFKLNVNTFYHF